MELSTIIAGIGSLKSAGDVIKGAVQIATDLKQFDLVQKLLSVQQALIEAQGQTVIMTENNKRLNEKVEELSMALDFKEKLEFDIKEQLFKKSDQYSGDNSRYCPHCLEAGQGVRRLIAKSLYGPEIDESGLEGTEAWVCPECKSYYRRITPMPPYN